MSGAMAHEEDAEVYNWRLLQEDKERELMGDRTHSTTNPPRVTYNTEDTIKAYKSHGHRPLSGYIRFVKYSQYEQILHKVFKIQSI